MQYIEYSKDFKESLEWLLRCYELNKFQIKEHKQEWENLMYEYHELLETFDDAVYN